MKRTLFLISCSDRKRRGGTATYEDQSGVRSLLSIAARERLDSGRRAAFQVVKDGSLRDAERSRGSRAQGNRALGDGPDLGGESAGTSIQYLPAHTRYEGRFYDAVSEVLRSREDMSWGLSWANDRGTLIVSGLYGLVTPSELIQMYDCHLGDMTRDQEPLVAYWQPIVTEVLKDVVRTHGFRRVVDLLSENLYQNVVDWSLLRRAGCAVYHRGFLRLEWTDALENLGRFYAHECLAGAAFNCPHDAFIERPYFEPSSERILFETDIGASRKPVVREGRSLTERWLAETIGTSWETLSPLARMFLVDSEVIFKGRVTEDASSAAVELSKALERWTWDVVVSRLRADASIGPEVEAKLRSMRYELTFGQLAVFLKDLSGAVGRSPRGTLDLDLVRSVGDDLLEINSRIGGQFRHSHKLDFSDYDEGRRLSLQFLARWGTVLR